MTPQPPAFYDLSPRIDGRLQVWPGDTPPSREVLLSMEDGANLTLSTLTTTVHVGAHADAPNHYAVDGQSIAERSLDFYMGPCQVFHVRAERGMRIMRAHLSGPIRAPRVLIATHTFPDPTQFNTDFAALDPSLIDELHAAGVRLVGLDTPSIDLFDSKDLPTHLRVMAYDMAVLEGLLLADVPEGLYELIALPLPLVGYDASPVRAILRTLPAGTAGPGAPL